jgi:hypothetical protein
MKTSVALLAAGRIGSRHVKWLGKIEVDRVPE